MKTLLHRSIIPLLLCATFALSGCGDTLSTISKTYKAATAGFNLSASGQTEGVVNDDAIVVNTEKALAISLDTFDLFLRLEYENRQGLEMVSPQIHAFAENLRRNGKRWIKSAEAAKNAYKHNRTAKNHANLVTAYKTLQAALAESKQYITKHSGV